MEASPQRIKPVPAPGGFRELWLLAYPVIIAMISQTVMGVVDTIFTGRIGTVEQGAVGFAAIIFWSVISLFVGTLTGVSTFAAQHHGAGDYARCGRDGWIGLYLTVPSALILGGIAFCSHGIFELIGSEPLVIPHAGDYLSIRLAGAFFVLINYAVISFLRGIGDTKTPMYFAIGANLLNIVLDYALILGNLGMPALGPRGAALASVLATAAISILYLLFFFSRKVSDRYQTRKFQLSPRKDILDFLKIGTPIGGSWVLEMVGWAVFMGYISRMGKVELAATIITFEVLHFSFQIAISLATAATTLVGQYLGAEDVATAEKTARTTIWSSTIYCVAVGILFLATRNLIMSVFSQDPQVIEVGMRLFIYVAIFQFFDGMGIACSGVIRGAGDTRWPMVLTAILAWVLFLPLTYGLTQVVDWGIDGAWTAATLFLVVLGSCMYLRQRSGKWKSMRV